MSEVFVQMHEKISAYLQEKEFKQNKRYAINTRLRDEIRYLEHKFDTKYIVATSNNVCDRLLVRGAIDSNAFLCELTRMAPGRNWSPSIVDVESSDYDHVFKLR